jgi:hypothetical protein
MRLDSIFATNDGKNNYPATKEALMKRFGVDDIRELRLSDLCEDWACHHGYGTNTYTGILKEGVSVSELELAMICDHGYSFFGGNSTISGRNFKVEIWFD